MAVKAKDYIFHPSAALNMRLIGTELTIADER
jgi:hypothetical protein